jgi:hypothetical protein
MRKITKNRQSSQKDDGVTGTLFDCIASQRRLILPILRLSKVLMLVIGLRLKIFDLVNTKDAKDLFTNLDLGIIREETVGGTMLTDKILKGVGHLGF